MMIGSSMHFAQARNRSGRAWAGASLSTRVRRWRGGTVQDVHVMIFVFKDRIGADFVGDFAILTEGSRPRL